MAGTEAQDLVRQEKKTNYSPKQSLAAPEDNSFLRFAAGSDREPNLSENKNGTGGRESSPRCMLIKRRRTYCRCAADGACDPAMPESALYTVTSTRRFLVRASRPRPCPTRTGSRRSDELYAVDGQVLFADEVTHHGFGAAAAQLFVINRRARLVRKALDGDIKTLETAGLRHKLIELLPGVVIQLVAIELEQHGGLLRLLIVVQIAKRTAQVRDLLRVAVGLLIHGGDFIERIRGARIGPVGFFRGGAQLGLVALEIFARLIERRTLLLLRRGLLVYFSRMGCSVCATYFLVAQPPPTSASASNSGIAVLRIMGAPPVVKLSRVSSGICRKPRYTGAAGSLRRFRFSGRSLRAGLNHITFGAMESIAPSFNSPLHATSLDDLLQKTVPGNGTARLVCDLLPCEIAKGGAVRLGCAVRAQRAKGDSHEAARGNSDHGLVLCVRGIREQGGSSANPVSDTLRQLLARNAKNLTAAAEAMPADKYSYHPTPEQITFGHLMMHIAQSNTLLCSKISGTAAPAATDLKETDGKEKLAAALKESFTYCTTALANVDDSGLGNSITLFGTRQTTKAGAIIALASDWADHYSAAAMYLRLNGILPPTAQPPAK